MALAQRQKKEAGDGGSSMRKCASRAMRAVRNSGFQSGTVSGSYFKRLSDILSDREALAVGSPSSFQLWE